MKRTKKKLKLDTQTVRQLDSSKLREAAGGTLNYNYQLQQPNFGAIRPTLTQVQTGCPSDTLSMECSMLGC